MLQQEVNPRVKKSNPYTRSIQSTPFPSPTIAIPISLNLNF